MRRRRGVPILGIPRIAEGVQLTLELPIGTSAGGFALSFVESTPPAHKLFWALAVVAFGTCYHGND